MDHYNCRDISIACTSCSVEYIANQHMSFIKEQSKIVKDILYTPDFNIDMYFRYPLCEYSTDQVQNKLWQVAEVIETELVGIVTKDLNNVFFVFKDKKLTDAENLIVWDYDIIDNQHSLRKVIKGKEKWQKRKYECLQMPESFYLHMNNCLIEDYQRAKDIHLTYKSGHDGIDFSQVPEEHREKVIERVRKAQNQSLREVRSIIHDEKFL